MVAWKWEEREKAKKFFFEEIMTENSKFEENINLDIPGAQ